MRRHLPHLYVLGRPLFVTFRLHGTLPTGRSFARETVTSGEAFVCVDRLLDRAVVGPRYLEMPEVAEVVACAIQDGRKDYDLHSWVVMPNHVHVLITPWTDVSNVMRRIKGGTAREANRQLHQVGRPFWQHESYDRLVRDGQEFRRIERYILLNPVRAGLAPRPELYRWSSAWAG